MVKGGMNRTPNRIPRPGIEFFAAAGSLLNFSPPAFYFCPLTTVTSTYIYTTNDLSGILPMAIMMA
jgi:hypothetical protein